MPKPIVRTAEIKVFKNRHGTLFNDAVVGPTGVQGEYLRWKWTRSGVVVIPKNGDLLGLCKMYRYALQKASFEFPRGAIDEGEDACSAAVRELREEAGLIATGHRRIGTIYADTGLIETPIVVVEADIDVAADQRSNIEPMESIDGEVVWLDQRQFMAWMRNGQIKCGVTLSAFSLSMVNDEHEGECNGW